MKNEICCGLVVLALLCPAISISWAEDDANGPVWVVASVDGGAWRRSQDDPAVRSSLKPGDRVRPNEQLETFRDNRIMLARDDRGRNLMAVQGAFSMKSSPGATRVELKRGRALAVLDGLSGTEDFSIATLAGVAAVRGTHFSVEALPAGMKVQTFQGEVLVRAYDASAKGSYSVRRPAPVEKGQETTFRSDSRQDLEAAWLEEQDWESHRSEMAAVRETRNALKSKGAEWFRAANEPERSRRVPSESRDGSGSEKSGPTILF